MLFPVLALVIFALNFTVELYFVVTGFTDVLEAVLVFVVVLVFVTLSVVFLVINSVLCVEVP